MSGKVHNMDIRGLYQATKEDPKYAVYQEEVEDLLTLGNGDTVMTYVAIVEYILEFIQLNLPDVILLEVAPPEEFFPFVLDNLEEASVEDVVVLVACMNTITSQPETRRIYEITKQDVIEEGDLGKALESLPILTPLKYFEWYYNRLNRDNAGIISVSEVEALGDSQAEYWAYLNRKIALKESQALELVARKVFSLLTERSNGLSGVSDVVDDLRDDGIAFLPNGVLVLRSRVVLIDNNELRPVFDKAPSTITAREIDTIIVPFLQSQLDKG